MRPGAPSSACSMRTGIFRILAGLVALAAAAALAFGGAANMSWHQIVGIAVLGIDFGFCSLTGSEKAVYSLFLHHDSSKVQNRDQDSSGDSEYRETQQ